MLERVRVWSTVVLQSAEGLHSCLLGFVLPWTWSVFSLGQSDEWNGFRVAVGMEQGGYRRSRAPQEMERGAGAHNRPGVAWLGSLDLACVGVFSVEFQSCTSVRRTQ